MLKKTRIRKESEKKMSNTILGRDREKLIEKSRETSRELLKICQEMGLSLAEMKSLSKIFPIIIEKEIDRQLQKTSFILSSDSNDQE